MICSEFYNGSGIGNQLQLYVTTRVIALDNGFDFGIMNPQKFKGHDFLNLDFGKEVIGGSSPQEGAPPTILPNNINFYYREKEFRYNGIDIREYDPLLSKISDNTKIDGYMQSEQYFIHRKAEIKEWLKVKEDKECYDFSSEDICIMNIRGGEYLGIPHVLLPVKYWRDAISNMLKVNNNLKFIIITDDVAYCNLILPEYPAYHFDIAKDYSIIKNAYYLILSNSSFAYFPSLTNDVVECIIGPKYWAGFNNSDGYWACATNLYKNWWWQNREGILYSHDMCLTEFVQYKNNNRIYENI